MTDTHGPPRGSAPNGLPSLATSATTPSRPSLETKARCSAKRWWLEMRYLAPPTGQYRTMLNTMPGCATAKRRDRRAAHAAAHEMRALDAEMIEQPFTLGDEMLPGDALHPAARLAAFAAVEQDAGKTLRQMIEQFYPGVAAERRPRLDHRVEAAGRVHQKRRPGADHLVTRRDAVDRDRGHEGSLFILRVQRAAE